MIARDNLIPCNFLFLIHSGINFVLSALVFNIFPTILEVSMVGGIMVSADGLFHKLAE